MPMQAPPLSSSRARSVAGGARGIEWKLLGCLLAACVPALIIAVAVLVARPDFHPGADQAVIEIGTGNAAHLTQELGAYSRFGWSHPGPSWYYLLAPFYRLLGEHSWAMIVAVAAFHAAAAAAIVLAVWRFGGRWLFVAAAAAVLLYVASLPAEVWRAVWNPYALLLPAGLLLVLCAGAAAGSRVSVVGALLCGSLLIQTHVGTAPLVLATWAGSAVLMVVSYSRRVTAPNHGPLPSRTTLGRERGWLVWGAIGLAGMWFPPLWQQLTAPRGNLSALAEFFTASHGPGHPWPAAVSALGRELAVFPLGRNNANLPTDISGLPLSVIAIVVGYAGLALGLAVVAWRSDRFLAALGTLSLIALPVSAFSVRRIVGEVDDYLVLWQSVLPMLVWIGWAGVLLRRLAAGRTGCGFRLTAGLVGVALGVLAGVEALRVTRLPSLSSAVSAAGVAQASGALTDPAVVQGPVLVRIETQYTWTLAAGLVLDLRKQGADPAVTDDWVPLFGEQLRSRRPRYVEVIVSSAEDAKRLPGDAAEVAEVMTAQGPATVSVRRSTVPLPSSSSTVAGSPDRAQFPSVSGGVVATTA